MLKQLSVFLENRPGTLVHITHILRDNHIDIRAMSIADSADFGILRLVVDDVTKAGDALRAGGAVVSVTEVLATAIPDTPGALTKLTELLGENGINIEYMYAFITRTETEAYVVLRVRQTEKATAVLSENGFVLIDTDKLNKIL